MHAPPSKPVLVKKTSSGGGNKKGTSAERRAIHNAVERTRRESLNVRFLELAASLPSTSSARRPSKNLIVNKCIQFVRSSLHNDAVLRLMLVDQMRQNQALLQELNQLRAERGMPPRHNSSTVQQQEHLQKPQAYSNSGDDHTTFSIDELAAAFSMPGLPPTLAKAEFTKQVTEQPMMFYAADPSSAQWLNSNGGSELDDDFLSNTTNTDDFSAAASDRSSPSFKTEDVTAAVAAANGQSFPVNHGLFQLQNGSSDYDSTANIGASPNSIATATTSPTYAQFLPDAHSTSSRSNSNATSMDFMPPITPETAIVFSNLMNSTYNGHHVDSTAHLSLAHPPYLHGDHHSHHHHHAIAPRGSPGSLESLTGFSHGHYFAMSA